MAYNRILLTTLACGKKDIHTDIGTSIDIRNSYFRCYFNDFIRIYKLHYDGSTKPVDYISIKAVQTSITIRRKLLWVAR